MEGREGQREEMKDAVKCDWCLVGPQCLLNEWMNPWGGSQRPGMARWPEEVSLLCSGREEPCTCLFVE